MSWTQAWLDPHPSLARPVLMNEGMLVMDASTKSAQKFTFCAPAAQSVQLVGDFTHWQAHPVSMKKAPGGVWSTIIQLTPGMYHYRFLVDGEWRDDPECTLRVANAFGSENAVRTV